MKRYLRELKPTVFDDIIAMVALYRPGPMRFIDSFIKRNTARKNQLPAPRHGKLAQKIPTVFWFYQEQFMQISKEWCGFTGASRPLRKAVKKKIDLMRKVKVDFVDGAVKLVVRPKNRPRTFWAQLEEFANYCLTTNRTRRVTG